MAIKDNSYSGPLAIGFEGKIVPIADPAGPYGECHVFGCDRPGEEWDLNFHAGEGDESPEVVMGVILCRQHGAFWDGRMAIVVAEASNVV